MSATDMLREDHRHVQRLGRVITSCYTGLYEGRDIPLSDISKITAVIEEFLDSIHYSREEDSYFPCVASYDHLKEEIRGLLIEHEFSRRIALKIKKHLQRWLDGEDAREPVARYLKTYNTYLQDHMEKEEAFFERAEAEVLSREEEADMYEQFRSVMATSKRVEVMLGEIAELEGKEWARGA